MIFPVNAYPDVADAGQWIVLHQVGDACPCSRVLQALVQSDGEYELPQLSNAVSQPLSLLVGQIKMHSVATYREPDVAVGI